MEPRIMGIDYGTKRVGLAFSDEGRKFALPHSVIPNDKGLTQAIVAIASENAVKDIVMGESRDYKQKPNAILEASTRLKGELESAGFTVHFEPEFMTSMQAERFQGKNALTDASAAAIILQAFLDKL